jgi:hypothetical protein
MDTQRKRMFMETDGGTLLEGEIGDALHYINAPPILASNRLETIFAITQRNHTVTFETRASTHASGHFGLIIKEQKE